MTRFEAIRQSFVALLVANTGSIGFVVHDARIDPFDAGELPALNVMPGSHERINEDQWLDNDAWQCDITVELYASGVNALSAMDAALQAMVPLAAAAAGLRALAYDIVYQGASAPEREGADTEYHTRTATWRFACLTDRNALT